jgi:hypothetical protein
MRPSLVLAALVFVNLGPGSALAQPSSQATAKAEAMYKEAVALMDRGDYAAACPKLEDVIRLVPEGIGAKVTLAECFEESGRLASAWAAFGVAEEAAAKAGQADRQSKARARREALEPKLAKLTIFVSERARSLEGLSVTRDGAPVDQAALGTAVPVDKGRHTVVATAGEFRFEKEVNIEADGAAASVLIEGPAAAVVAPPPPGRDVPTEKAGLGAQRTAGIVALGASGVGFGLGAFFGFRAISKKDESNQGGHCRDGNRCDAVGVALRDEGLTAATVSTVLFIAGGVAAAGGAVLFLTAPRPSSRPSAQVAIGPGTVAIRGSW